MKKCKKCGAFIFKSNNFCPKCGNAFKSESNKEPEEYSYSCIHCGAKYKAFTCKCSHCGQEQIGVVRSKSIKEFTQKLQEIDALKAKKGIAALINRNQIKNIDDQKTELIKTYVIPNSKEDVLEFMVLATSNIDVSVLMAQNEAELNLKKNEFLKQKALANAWYTKREQVYSKAKISFGNDEDFCVIQRLYDEKESEINLIKQHREKERRRNNALLYFIVAVALIAVIVGVIGETLSKDNTPSTTVETVVETSSEQIETNEPKETEPVEKTTEKREGPTTKKVSADKEETAVETEEQQVQTSESSISEYDIEKDFRDNCVDHKISEVYDYILESGYEMTYTAETSNGDFTESVRTDEEIRNSFYITKVKSVDLDKNAVELEITSQLIYELNAKLDVMDAWFAMQDYGEKYYKEFELHYYAGVISKTPVDENTWLLSATCDADGYKGLTCTATVTGTSENPRIIDFDVR